MRDLLPLFAVFVIAGIATWVLTHQDEVRHVPFPQGLAQLEGVADHDAPAEFRHQLGWIEPTEGRDPTQAELERLSVAKKVICWELNLTDQVRDAIENSTVLEWFEVGRHAAGNMHWISRINTIRGLALSHAFLRGDDLEMLGNMRELEWLDLRYVRLAADGIPRFPDLPTLQVLFLYGEAWGDKEVKLIVERAPSLRALWLEDTRITADSIASMANSELPLVWLSLKNCQAIDQDALESLARLPALQYLRVTGSGLGTRHLHGDEETAHMNRVQRAVPKCHVLYGN